MLFELVVWIRKKSTLISTSGYRNYRLKEYTRLLSMPKRRHTIKFTCTKILQHPYNLSSSHKKIIFSSLKASGETKINPYTSYISYCVLTFRSADLITSPAHCGFLPPNIAPVINLLEENTGRDLHSVYNGCWRMEFSFSKI